MGEQDDVLTALHTVLDILKRIEERQIRTTEAVMEVERQEQKQVQGSFGTTEEPT